MRHLRPADYTRQPWANGRGTTTEIFRLEVDGLLHLRLSMATVAEDGPFSLFPGIERNLTVISGAGFVLEGDGTRLPCLPLVPVAFPGDVAVRAVDTRNRPSDDFNVLTDRRLPRPVVTVERTARQLPAGVHYVFALGAASVGGVVMGRHEVIVTDGAARIEPVDPVIAVRMMDQNPADGA